jgi:hypothetical protein
VLGLDLGEKVIVSRTTCSISQRDSFLRIHLLCAHFYHGNNLVTFLKIEENYFVKHLQHLCII